MLWDGVLDAGFGIGDDDSHARQRRSGWIDDTAGDRRLLGVEAPTGNQVKVTATVWYRIEDGKLAEGWINRDDVGLMRQLGVIPSP